jgi:hypothetical protein
MKSLKELKHTKGNWELKPNSHYNDIVVESGNKRIRISTLIHEITDDAVVTRNFTEEDNANAKLVAASPLLLEALILISNQMSQLEYTNGWNAEKERQVINAILKATN